MKDFFKYTLATITGIVATTIIGSILLFVMIVAIIAGSSSESEYTVDKESVLVLNLKGQLSDWTSATPSFMDVLQDKSSLTLDDLRSSIQKAKKHKNIKGIYLDMGGLSSGIANLTELRSELSDFKSSGKFIIAYADQYSQGDYYLSSLADKIYVNPQGSINWAGLSATPIFYTNLMKKIGVSMQIFKVGTYKSAVEPYTEDKMSKASKEQVEVYLNDIWGTILDGVSMSRNISIEKLNNLANEMPLFQTTEFYIENNLADSLVYRNDMKKVLENYASNDKLKTVSLKNMKLVKAPINKEAQTIAVYYAEGAIVDSAPTFSEESLISASKMTKDLKKLEENESIKGVVIRVNSPGGSAFASEQIWKAISDLKAKKSVAVSMGNYAASGGYYISAASDCIVAEPTTITGSIGIFAMIPNASELTEKIGLTFDTVKTNKFADFGALGRPLNTEEQQLLQHYIDGGYELFVKRCADGRHMSVDEIKKIAEGRVWTGNKALELGLVDMLGGLDKAIEIVAENADIEHYRLRKYPEEEDFITKILNTSLTSSIEAKLLGKQVKDALDETRLLEHLSKESILQARIPYTLNIK